MSLGLEQSCGQLTVSPKTDENVRISRALSG